MDAGRAAGQPSGEEPIVRTIAIINQKGGCGKTTTAINLAGVLAASEQRTLLIDLDPQAHCAAGLAIPEQRIDVHIGDALLTPDDKSIDWTRLLWRVSRNLDLAPSTVRLAGIESARGGLAAMDSAERRLASVLARVADQYDVALIDCPPSISLLTFNALVASGEVIIPVETGFFALQGAAKQISTIQAVGKKLGVAPQFRILPTLHDTTSPMAKDVLEELHRRCPGKVIPVVIRQDLKLREAVTFGQTIVTYAPDSTGAADYLALGKWLLSQGAALNARSGLQRPGPAPITHAPSGPVTVLDGAADAMLASIRSSLLNQSAATAQQLLSDGGPSASSPSHTSAPAATSARAIDMISRLGRPHANHATHDLGGPGVSPVAQGGIATLDPAIQSAHLAPSIHAVVSTAAALDTSRKTATDVMAAGLMGVRSTAQGVLFIQPASLGRSVAIAGEFNGWSPTANTLRRSDALDVLEAIIPLAPGRYPYRLVVDGRWITDPYNPNTEANPFGETNSIFVVP